MWTFLHKAVVSLLELMEAARCLHGAARVKSGLPVSSGLEPLSQLALAKFDGRVPANDSELVAERLSAKEIERLLKTAEDEIHQWGLVLHNGMAAPLSLQADRRMARFVVASIKSNTTGTSEIEGETGPRQSAGAFRVNRRRRGFWPRGWWGAPTSPACDSREEPDAQDRRELSRRPSRWWRKGVGRWCPRSSTWTALASPSTSHQPTGRWFRSLARRLRDR
jgi:hypothetical protein